MLEHSGAGREAVYRLSRASAILNEGVAYDMTRRLDREAIKVRILSLLKDRPLRNADISQLYRPGPPTGLPDHERAGVGRSGLPGRPWTNGSMAPEAIIEQTVNQRSLFASLFAS